MGYVNFFQITGQYYQSRNPEVHEWGTLFWIKDVYFNKSKREWEINWIPIVAVKALLGEEKMEQINKSQNGDYVYVVGRIVYSKSRQQIELKIFEFFNFSEAARVQQALKEKEVKMQKQSLNKTSEQYFNEVGTFQDLIDVDEFFNEEVEEQ